MQKEPVPMKTKKDEGETFLYSGSEPCNALNNVELIAIPKANGTAIPRYN